MAGKKFDFGSMAIALIVGLIIGIAVGLGARRLGVPQDWVAPLTGAVVGGLVPLIYSARTKGG